MKVITANLLSLCALNNNEICQKGIIHVNTTAKLMKPYPFTRSLQHTDNFNDKQHDEALADRAIDEVARQTTAE